MPTIKLLSSDDEVFEVDEIVAKCSGTLKNWLELPGDLHHGNIITLQEINSAILRKVLIWLTYHFHNQGQLDYVHAWEANFLDVNHNILARLMEAAHYLNINSLLTAAAKTIADMIKGRTEAQVCEVFDITDVGRGAKPQITKINTVL